MNLNLLLAFLLEIGMFIAYGYWGFHLHVSRVLKFIIGIGMPLIVMIVWGFFAAPNSTAQLHQPYLIVLQFVVFCAASAMLYVSRQRLLATILMVLWAVSAGLAAVWHQ